MDFGQNPERFCIWLILHAHYLKLQGQSLIQTFRTEFYNIKENPYLCLVFAKLLTMVSIWKSEIWDTMWNLSSLGIYFLNSPHSYPPKEKNKVRFKISLNYLEKICFFFFIFESLQQKEYVESIGHIIMTKTLVRFQKRVLAQFKSLCRQNFCLHIFFS